MATAVTRYVNTASTPGGDGTTNNTSGATRAYASLNEAEAALQADLVSADQVLTVLCSGTTADTTAVSIDGWTFDATRYLKVEGAAALTPTWDTSKYRIEATSADGGDALTVVEEFTYLKNLQLQKTKASNLDKNILQMNSAIGAGSVYLENLVLKGIYSSGTGNFRGLFCGDGSATYRAKNILIFDVNGGGGTGFYQNSFPTMYCYNFGVHNCDTGYFTSDSGTTLKNCWAQSCTDGYSGTFNGNSDYNLSELSSDAPGSNSKNSTVITFVNEAADNFSLDSADTGAKDSGTDLSADGGWFGTANDIAGDTRSGTWDIGPDEVSASGVSVSVNTLSVTLTIPAYSVTGGAAVAASTQAVTLSAPARTSTGGASVTPTTQSVTLSVPARTATGGATVAASVQSVTLNVPAASAAAGVSVSLNTQTVTLSAPARTSTGGAAVSASTQSVTLNAPTRTVTGGASIALPTQSITLSVIAVSAGSYDYAPTDTIEGINPGFSINSTGENSSVQGKPGSFNINSAGVGVTVWRT